MKIEKLNETTNLCTAGNGVSFLSFTPFERFSDWLVQGMSTRLGGVSRGCLSSLNLGYERNDIPENVDRNWKLLSDAAGFDCRKLSFPNQWHTTNVRVAGPGTEADGTRPDKDSEPIDGQITNVPGPVLITYGADCVPVLLADEEHRAIGQCHAGWKGTVLDIVSVTVDKMAAEFGTDPKKITAIIGPSISMDAYEVGADVADRFIEKYKIDVSASSELISSGNREGKFYLDLWEANRRNLINAGLDNRNIFISGVCTFKNSELMYSHRRMGNERGVMAAFMSLRLQELKR